MSKTYFFGLQHLEYRPVGKTRIFGLQHLEYRPAGVRPLSDRAIVLLLLTGALLTIVGFALFLRGGLVIDGLISISLIALGTMTFVQGFTGITQLVPIALGFCSATATLILWRYTPGGEGLSWLLFVITLQFCFVCWADQCLPVPKIKMKK
jgi:hypothetical protein